MLVFSDIKSLQKELNSKGPNQSLGFVPTMGALHKGHLSLVKMAKSDNQFVATSIFVNPTQFNNASDLENYPKTLDADLEMLKEAGCDYVFVPTVSEMYAENVSSEVFSFDGLEFEMEGKFRSGHFDGVGTIVRRLFEIVKPTKAYFGEKDFQQLQIIRTMVRKLDLSVQIVGCPIFREDDGLAMSSRNQRLTKEHRNAAPLIFKVLSEVKNRFGIENAKDIVQWVENEFKREPLLELEYFEIADESTLKAVRKIQKNGNYRAFIAVFAGEIRLIDNISLTNKTF